MRRVIILGLASALSLSAAATAQQTIPILGRWQTAQEHGVVEIFSCGAAICGRIVDGDAFRVNPDQRDIRNGNRALRNRRLMNLPVLQNFTGGPTEWSGGPVYDPVTGDGAARGTIVLANPGTLKVKGCIGLFFCRTQTWTRLR